MNFFMGKMGMAAHGLKADTKTPVKNPLREEQD